MKKILATMLALVMALTLCSTASADEPLSSVYVNTSTGVDTNVGSQTAPVKTLKKAMELVAENGTVYVTGNTTVTFWGDQNTDTTIAGGHYYVTKSVTIEGYGDGMYDAHGIKLPTDFGGALTLRNIDFDGTTAIGIYSGAIAATAELVIDNCRFAQAGGNCVFLGSEIKSLTVNNCTFTVASGAGSQYLIWTVKGAETVKITNNKINVDGTNTAKGAIHLGDGGTTAMNAIITGNQIDGFNRGIQMAFNTGKNDTVNVADNTFTNVTEGAVILHENMAANPTATITYGLDNTLAGTTGAAIVAKTGDNGEYVDVTQVVAAGTGGALVMNEDGSYAVVETHTVTFNPNNDDDAFEVPVASGSAVAEPDDPIRNGYTFKGWYLDGENGIAGEAYNFATPVIDDIALTAVWEKNPTRYHPPISTTTETKAESPKTFDAGIAVYGVMAVSSIMGMGYVGKKKF